MDIDTCMAQIIVLQKEVSITIPGTVGTMDLEVAYKYVPADVGPAAGESLYAEQLDPGQRGPTGGP